MKKEINGVTVYVNEKLAKFVVLHFYLHIYLFTFFYQKDNHFLMLMQLIDLNITMREGEEIHKVLNMLCYFPQMLKQRRIELNVQ